MVSKFRLLSLVIMALAAETIFAIDLQDSAANTREGTIHVKALENGMTLYMFDPDIGNVPVCKGDCAEVWPPILLTKEELAGLGQNDLGSIERSNGKIQLTLSGRALYTYFGDRVPGDAKGDGLGGVWHVIKSKE